MANVLTRQLWHWTENISPHPLSYAAGYRKHHASWTDRYWLDGAYGYGRFLVQGSVRVDGDLAARRVTLLRRRDFSLAGQTWSDPVTGAYVFESIADGDYMIVCDDFSQTHNAAAADWVAPEPMD